MKIINEGFTRKYLKEDLTKAFEKMVSKELKKHGYNPNVRGANKLIESAAKYIEEARSYGDDYSTEQWLKDTEKNNPEELECLKMSYEDNINEGTFDRLKRSFNQFRLNERDKYYRTAMNAAEDLIRKYKFHSTPSYKGFSYTPNSNVERRTYTVIIELNNSNDIEKAKNIPFEHELNIPASYEVTKQDCNKPFIARYAQDAIIIIVYAMVDKDKGEKDRNKNYKIYNKTLIKDESLFEDYEELLNTNEKFIITKVGENKYALAKGTPPVINSRINIEAESPEEAKEILMKYGYKDSELIVEDYNSDVRHYSDMLFDMIESNVVDVKQIAKDLIYWCSEDDIKRFMEVNDLIYEEEVDESFKRNKRLREAEMSEIEDVDRRVIRTGLTGKKNNDILNSIIGQLSDGYWENDRSMAGYWMFADISDNNDILISERMYKKPFKTSKTNIKNKFYNMSDYAVRKFFANKIKFIARVYLKDNNLDPNKNWNADNEEKCEYLGYNSGVTIADAYAAYQALK